MRIGGLKISNSRSLFCYDLRMESKTFNYAGVPKTQKNRRDTFLLAYLVLLFVGLVGFIIQMAALAVIPLTLCLFLRLYEVLFTSNYLHAFARDNNLLIYDYPKLKFTELPFFNKIYKIASVSSGVQIQTGPPLIEVFTYSTTRLRHSAQFQVIHIKLSHPLPNTIIDGRANDYLLRSDLPGELREMTDKYELEGDFPKYFRVYAEAHRPSEILQLLSPDVMATLIDDFSDSNIEFINASVFITTRTVNVTQASFKRSIELSLKLSQKLEEKSRNTLRVQNVYNDRVTEY
jgi:hypothetical protein